MSRDSVINIAKFSHASIAALLLTGCTPRDGVVASEGSQQAAYRPTATIQDLMDSEVDPAADFIWDSVGTVITAAGTENRQPRTDEQWSELRRKAIILVEAANLLLIPGRHVANTEFPSAGPGVLSSTDIEQKLEGDRAAFNVFAVDFEKWHRKNCRPSIKRMSRHSSTPAKLWTARARLVT
jgi:hypothetical protein